MTNKDLSTINRFLGVVEGVVELLPENAQSVVFDYLELVIPIIDKEYGDGERKEQ